MAWPTPNDVDLRVLRGAQFLDAHRPGWWDQIDLDTLRMSDPCMCVVAQLTAKLFSQGATELMALDVEPSTMDDQYAWTLEYGFEANEDENYDELVNPSDDEYTLLLEAWRDEITLRRQILAGDGR